MSKIDISRKQELCLRCMECCKVIGIPSIYNPEYDQMIHFYTIRGCSIKKGGLDNSVAIVVVPYPCPELSPLGCKSYEDRPLWCRLYDGKIDPVVRDKCLWNKEGV